MAEKIDRENKEIIKRLAGVTPEINRKEFKRHQEITEVYKKNIQGSSNRHKHSAVKVLLERAGRKGSPIFIPKSRLPPIQKREIEEINAVVGEVPIDIHKMLKAKQTSVVAKLDTITGSSVTVDTKFN